MGEKTPAPLSLHLPTLLCGCSSLQNLQISHSETLRSKRAPKSRGGVRREERREELVLKSQKMIKVGGENVIPARLPLLLSGKVEAVSPPVIAPPPLLLLLLGKKGEELHTTRGKNF